MQLTTLDWAVLGGYVLFALAVGIAFTRRASRDTNEYFLAGRTLPWWIAGTSMVATTFASDTPLVISGWVRDVGIWQNWLWWCTAAGTVLTVFLFARYWRRGEVMTTAEMAELRYGGAGARLLRGFLGVYQSAIGNTIILCWVILAAAKIMDVLFEVDKNVAVAVACLIALSYSLLAGFWGVVVTDLVQFAMAMVGSIALAALAWEAIGGGAGLLEAAALGNGFTSETLAFFPPHGPGGVFDASFWTISFTTVCVFLGVQWWAYEYVDGGILAVQRISASRSERDGMLAMLWYAVAHFALRPWPWILVGLASIVLLPTIEVQAPFDGTVSAVSATKGAETLTLSPTGEGESVVLDAIALGAEEDGWYPSLVTVEGRSMGFEKVEVGAEVREGETVLRTDSERAYVVMMRNLLPAGLLGLAIAALLAAFMSTVDTHVNLASSFFVNDVYRRFVRRSASARHYVLAGRVTSVFILAMGGLLAWQAESISDLFTFFLAFLSGVGPVYVLRWLWWRVKASTEIVAMVASSAAATTLTFTDRLADWTGWPGFAALAAYDWPVGGLADGGELTVAGRLVVVVLCSTSLALLSLLLLPRPRPEQLVAFYRRVRPIGAWGPVRALCPDVEPPREARAILIGVVGGLMVIYGFLFAAGWHFLMEPRAAMLALIVGFVGTHLVAGSLRALRSVDGPGDAERNRRAGDAAVPFEVLQAPDVPRYDDAD